MAEEKGKVQEITQNTVMPIALVISIVGSAVSYGQHTRDIEHQAKEIEEIKEDRIRSKQDVNVRITRTETMVYRMALKMRVHTKDLYEGE